MDSLAIEKPQSAAQQYGLEALETFQTFSDRDAYRAWCGLEAPPFNPALPEKRWFDSAQAQKPGTYPVLYSSWVVGVDGKPEYRDFAISAAQASTLNLKGKPRRVAYSVQPTVAVQVMPDGIAVTIQAIQLSTLEQAQALAVELGMSAATVVNQLAGDTSVNWGSELRRVYTVGEENVGKLLFDKNSHGMGANGRWILLNGTHRWIFIDDDDGSNSTLGLIPVPNRTLKDNEALKVGFGNILQVWRTDSDEPTSGAGLSSAQAAQLKQAAADIAGVKDSVAKIAKALGI